MSKPMSVIILGLNAMAKPAGIWPKMTGMMMKGNKDFLVGFGHFRFFVLKAWLSWYEIAVVRLH